MSCSPSPILLGNSQSRVSTKVVQKEKKARFLEPSQLQKDLRKTELDEGIRENRRIKSRDASLSIAILFLKFGTRCRRGVKSSSCSAPWQTSPSQFTAPSKLNVASNKRFRYHVHPTRPSIHHWIEIEFKLSRSRG